jgi:hypothetical protein
MIEKFRNCFLDLKQKIFRKSRPESAKSASSHVTIKSFKSVKNFTQSKKKKSIEKVSKIKEKKSEPYVNGNSEKEFSEFRSNCHNFLVNDFQWALKELRPQKKEEVEKKEVVKRQLPKTSQSIKALFVPAKVEIVSAPVRGVENVRKAVLHEIEFGKPPRSSAPKMEEKNEDLFKENQKSNSRRPSTANFKRQSIVSQDFPSQEKPVSFEEFEEVIVSSVPGPKKPQPSQVKTTSEPHLEITASAGLSIVSHQEPPSFNEKFLQDKKNQKSKKKTVFDENFIKIICKIQARVRGIIARERFRILKKTPKILFRGAKKIGGNRCFVTILQKDQKKIVKINDGNEDHIWVTSEDLPAEEIFAKLDKNEKGFHLKKASKPAKADLLNTCKLKLSDDFFNVKYFFDWQTKVLKIEATKYSNSKVFSTEKPNLAFNSKALIIRYINDEIQPNLCIKDQKLVIDKEKQVIERQFFAKGSRIFYNKEVFFTVFKIITEDGESVEVFADSSGLPVSFKISEFFPVSEILPYLEMLQIKSIDEDPHAIFLVFHLQDSKIVLRKLDKNWLKLVYNQKGFFIGNEFQVKIFKVHDDACSFFFQVFAKDCPMISSFSVPDKRLNDMFKLNGKKVEASLDRIVKTLVVKDFSLELNPVYVKSESSFIKEIRIIIKIQSYIRGHLTRDRLRLVGEKNPLVYSTTRFFDENPANFNFFKLGSGMLIEVLFGDLNKSFYAFLIKPELFFSRFSRLYDIKCICNTIVFNMETFVLPTLKGNIGFAPCAFFAVEELVKSKSFPVIRTKLNSVGDFVMIIREIQNSDLIVKVLRLSLQPDCVFKVFTRNFMEEIVQKPFSLESFIKKIEVVNGKIIVFQRNEVKKIENSLNSPRVIFRTIKVFEAKLYQVVLTIEHEDLLVFTFRQGSEIDSEQVLKISKSNAFVMTGYSEEFLIAMCDFIVKKMVVMENGEIKIIPPEVKFDMSSTLVKIQSFIRGFICRKRLKFHLQFKIFFSTVLKLDHITYKALLYHCIDDYSIALIKNTQVISAKLNKKLLKENQERIEKIAISKILPKLKLKEKDGKKKITGLQEWKKKNSAFINIFENASPLPTNRSRESIISRSSDQPVKVLKWRASRDLNGQDCLLSFFEVAGSGLVEVLIKKTGSVLKLDVKLELIEDPELLAAQLEIKSGKLSVKNEELEVVLTDKRFISNKLAEVSIFFTDKGYFATAFLVDESRSLNAFIGTEVKPEDAIKSLKIRNVMGQDVLLMAS